MPTFRIKEAFNLKSAGGLLLMLGQIYGTEDEAQVAELRGYAAAKACEEMLPPSKAAAKAPEKAADPDDDISLVKGIGKGTMERLAEKGIATKSQLGAALSDPKRSDQMKELLGPNYEKVLKQFQPDA